MMMDAYQRRRLAARACFKPYLNPAQLDEAIRTLDLGYQTDSPTAMIGYVKLISTQYGIDEVTRKALHSQLYQLLQQPLSYFETPAIAEPAPPAETKAIEDQTPPANPPVQSPPHVNLFTILAQQIVSQCDSVELLEIVCDLCKSQKQPLDTIKRWQARPDDYSWAVELSPAALTTLVHWLYTAVCELCGPIDADRAFHEALATCQKHPDAKQFAPANFF